MSGERSTPGGVTCIDGHLEERRQQMREHMAGHLERLARRVRGEELDPLAVAAVVLMVDGSLRTELCYGDAVGGMALAAALGALERDIADGEG